MTRKPIVAQVLVAAVLTYVVLGGLGYVRWLISRRGNEAAVSLADLPHELKRASTAQVIDAGIEKPISPWAWQELERRRITADDADQILERLTAWLRREHPQGISQPLSWLDEFLKQLDASGFLTQERKIAFLEALHGDMRGDHVIRLRAGTNSLTLQVEWKPHWHHDLFGMTLMNEVQSLTLDGKSLSADFPANWGSQSLYQSFPLPSLPPGKHVVQLSVLSAVVASSDLVGLKGDARSPDWPPAGKRWTRTLAMEVTVFPDDAEIIVAMRDPSLDPSTHGLSIEPILIRGSGNSQSATLQFEFGKSLAVPIGFDVSMRLAGESIACGSLWAVKSGNGRTSGGNILSAALPPIGADVKDADVVLTPNPRPIELRPEVDRFWGDEIVFRNVSIRRLEGTDANSSDVEIP
jgi:hypothetical protein